MKLKVIIWTQSSLDVLKIKLQKQPRVDSNRFKKTWGELCLYSQTLCLPVCWSGDNWTGTHQDCKVTGLCVETLTSVSVQFDSSLQELRQFRSLPLLKVTPTQRGGSWCHWTHSQPLCCFNRSVSAISWPSVQCNSWNKWHCWYFVIQMNNESEQISAADESFMGEKLKLSEQSRFNPSLCLFLGFSDKFIRWPKFRTKAHNFSNSHWMSHHVFLLSRYAGLSVLLNVTGFQHTIFGL